MSRQNGTVTPEAIGEWEATAYTALRRHREARERVDAWPADREDVSP